MATFKVEDTVGVGNLLANLLEGALSMELARIFAQQDALEVLGDHCGDCARVTGSQVGGMMDWGWELRNRPMSCSY